jgi:integrase
MKPATILRIHSIISSALDLALRYEWADRNVAKNARPPHPRKREPDPPSPERAARLLNLVWAEDEEFGLFLWTAFTTGARRREVTALRENSFDLASHEVRVERNCLVKQGQRIEKAPKDGEGRRLSLDLLTCELLRDRFSRRRAELATVGEAVPDDASAFSPDPAGAVPWNPDTMTHRYRRYARRVGITSSLKELRHYSATQLLANGVDLNTVAGRLGHAEGSTTLKFYASSPAPPTRRPLRSSRRGWTASAERNGSASSTASTRLPAPTGSVPSPRSSVRRPGLRNIPLCVAYGVRGRGVAAWSSCQRSASPSSGWTGASTQCASTAWVCAWCAGCARRTTRAGWTRALSVFPCSGRA